MASRAETLDHALAYTARGWRVVPIKPGGKHPPIDEWQKAATNDPSLVENFWTAWPRHGIGIATGQQSGIFVLDVDVADGKQGDETLADLEAEHGPLPDTVECITGSGGRHLYFRYPDELDIRNDAGRRLGPGLDIRGEGGQVLAPPTTHPNGRMYMWEADHDPMDGQAVAEAPAWLLELLTSAPTGTPRAERTPYTGIPRPGDLYASSVTWPELLQPDGATFLGDRIHHATGIHYEIWARPGADHTSATLNYGGTDCLHVFTPNWPGLEEGGTYSKFAYYALTRHAGDFSAAARAVRQTMPEPPPASIDQLGPTSEQAKQESDEEDEEQPSSVFIDWAAFWARDDSGEEWLAEPLIPAGRSIAIYAGAKQGKSDLVLDIVFALASGKPCLGQRPRDPVDVMYLDYEMTQDDLYDRLVDGGYGPDDDLSHLHYASLPSLPPLDTAEGAQAVLRLVESCGARLVVIDTLSRVISNEENDASAVLNLYRHLGVPLKAKGITVIRLDHAGKDASKGARGTSAKNDDVDVVWQLTRLEDAAQMKATHRRVSWVPALVNLDRQTDPIRYLPAKDSEVYPAGTKEIAALLDGLGLPVEGLSKRQAVKALQAAGHGSRGQIVAAALRWRKAEQPLFLGGSGTGFGSGTTPGTTHAAGSGNHPGNHLTENTSEQARNHLGTTGNHLAGQVGTSVGPYKGPTGSQPQPRPDEDDPNSIW